MAFFMINLCFGRRNALTYQFKNVMAEFFCAVYYRYYKENGIVCGNLYEPSLLAFFDLPYDAAR